MTCLVLGLNLHSACDLTIIQQNFSNCFHLCVMHPMLMQSMTCELSPQSNFIPSFLLFILTSSSISICLSKFLMLSPTIFAGLYNFMLSANSISIFCTGLCKSLMRTLNRAASRTDSCGILHITFFQLDRGMLITILGIQLTDSEESHLV